MLYSIIESLLLTISLSIDTFISSFAYGTKKITIPFKSAATISLVSTAILGIAILLGSFINKLIPSSIVSFISFAILFTIGIIKLFDSIIKNYIKKHKITKKKLNFSMFSLKVVLNIYANPEKADIDKSKILSEKEALLLGIALSLDGLAAGISIGLSTFSNFQIIIYSLIICLLAIISGHYIGRKIANKIKCNLSWTSGLILIILAISKL